MMSNTESLSGLLHLARYILGTVAGFYLLRLVARRLYQIFIYPYFASPLRQLPGPRNHHFLLGQAINQFQSGNPNEPYLSWVRRWPEAHLIRYFDVGNSDAVLVTSLAAHKEILRDKAYSFQKPPFFTRLVADIVGLGLVFAEGSEHKKQRRALAGHFSPGHLKRMLPLFQSKAHQLSNLLDRIIDTEVGVVELVSLYSKIMLDIMGVFALGIELDNLEPTRNQNGNKLSFYDCYHEVFEPQGVGQLLTAINGIFPVRWLPLEANRRFVQANKTIRGQLTDIIRDRIQSIKASKAAGMDGRLGEDDDLLTYMVVEKYFPGDGDGDRWTEQDILNQILSFLAAGHETTAGACVWATQLMIEHPNKAERLRAEVSELLRHSPTPNQRSIESLHYLNNFVREVLRLQCPAINIPREAAEDVLIQGTLLRRGTTVVMQPAIVQRNPNIWGPDCDEFKPDRWDHLDGEAADPWAFMTFSQGPRVCIGKAMFMLEFKVILVELVSKFHFDAVDHMRMEDIKLINPSALLRPDGGLRVRVRKVTP
ncbi:cytochrome P450 4F5 [Podospora aff. communis PSN243]|uniref:Cytochrome P450 4F5 n=1 Tax=Podospora aff. communis PSN243 TaxID=3040156 RepID=A0AAV9GDW6_9PEZI|nr:cytochrome P450 4F5 [Podospora aff. communis PSN243]